MNLQQIEDSVRLTAYLIWETGVESGISDGQLSDWLAAKSYHGLDDKSVATLARSLASACGARLSDPSTYAIFEGRAVLQLFCPRYFSSTIYSRCVRQRAA